MTDIPSRLEAFRLAAIKLGECRDPAEIVRLCADVDAMQMELAAAAEARALAAEKERDEWAERHKAQRLTVVESNDARAAAEKRAEEAVRCSRHNSEHLCDFEVAAFRVRSAFFPGGTVPAFTALQAEALELLRLANDGVASPNFGVGECKTSLSAALSRAAELERMLMLLADPERSVPPELSDEEVVVIELTIEEVRAARALLSPRPTPTTMEGKDNDGK